MEVTAVLFDMGGTLLSYENRAGMGSAMLAALRRLGFSTEDPAVRTAIREAGEQIERAYAVRPSFIHRDLFRDRVALTAELLGVTAPPDVLDRFDEEQRQAVIDHLVPMPDAHETLGGLRARGIYVAVVSNADDDYMVPVLARHGLDALLDHATSSEEADSCKPDRRIFEYSLAKAGRGAHETLFVGDSPHHDVAGANAAGMRTALIGEPCGPAPLSHGLEPGEPDHVVKALIELLAIVDRYNGRT